MAQDPARPLSPASTLVAATLLAVGLSGCVAPEAPPHGAAAAIIGQECLGAATSHCRWENGSLVLRNLEIAGRPDSPLGLFVDRLSVGLVIDGLVLSGFDTTVFVGRTCDSCHVLIANSTLTAGFNGVQVGYVGTAAGGLTIRDTNIALAPTSSSGEASREAGFRVDSHGIIVYDLKGGLVLEGVSLNASPASMGRALWDQGATALDASGVTIAGFGRAILGNWTSVSLRNVDIDCIFDAIWLRGQPDLYADRLSIRDCGLGEAACPSGCDYSGERRPSPAIEAGAWERPVGKFVLTNLSMTNNANGIYVDGVDVRLQDFLIRDGIYGASIGARGEFVMANGTVSGHARYGVTASVDKLYVRHVAFSNNGFGPVEQSHQDHEGLDIRAHNVNGQLNPGPRSIQQSSFTGNTPFGLVNDYDDVFLDASLNWWGSPLGPSPGTPAALGNPLVPGFGDMAVGGAVTAPHLTEPPP